MSEHRYQATDVDSDADIDEETPVEIPGVDSDADFDVDVEPTVGADSDADVDSDADIDSDADTDSDADAVEEPPLVIPVVRQWVSLAKGSCDVRVGSDTVGLMGGVLRGAAGHTRGCALVVQAGTDEALVEDVRRQLTDPLSHVTRIDIPAATRTLAAASGLAVRIAQAEITSDDLICAIGGTDALSLVAAVAHEWCGGTSLAAVPTDVRAAALAVVTPRGLDVDGVPQLVWTPGYAKHCFIDLDRLGVDASDEDVRFARALMAITALEDNERSFSALWDRANDIAKGDLVQFAQQVVDMLKSRGRLSASTSIAVRQSLTYGETFLRAVRTLVDGTVPDSAILADAMRFTSRISCGQGNLSVDDVLAIDELLQRLDLGQVAYHIEPADLVAALKADRFRRSSRFLLGMPRALGRVRLANVEDDLLAEHARAFCATREA